MPLHLLIVRDLQQVVVLTQSSETISLSLDTLSWMFKSSSLANNSLIEANPNRVII